MRGKVTKIEKTSDVLVSLTSNSDWRNIIVGIEDKRANDEEKLVGKIRQGKIICKERNPIKE